MAEGARIPRVYCGSVATETNTFAPLRTDISNFRESFFAEPGEHPDTPTLCSAVFTSLRRRAAAGEVDLVEGTAAWAEPGGLINRDTWAFLKDRIVGEVRAAMPVDAVVLGLHGAMIADGCLDPEGTLAEDIRAIVGPDVIISASFDPHSHLSPKRVANLDIFTVFKEFPHTDFAETGEACVDLTMRTLAGEIDPKGAVFDVRMIEIMPTSRPPMRAFVDRMKALEAQEGIVSVSAIHGFPAGDSPDIGARIAVFTDGDQARADALARELGMDLFALRGKTRPDMLAPEVALERAGRRADETGKPVVVADVWDNPGGGTPGDATTLLSMILEQGLEGVAFGTIWDPMAVRLCLAAGEGAVMDLRFGGKTSAAGGAPIDAEVTVTRLVRNAVQSFGASVVPLGDSAAIRIGGVDIVLNSNRAQAFSPDLFSNLGIDPLARRILVVKSTNHFYGAFAPIAGDVLYASVEGPYPNDPTKTNYRNLTRRLWPMVADPHAGEGAGRGS